MYKLKVKPLTMENFAPYGYFVNMINPTTTPLGDPNAPVCFYRDMIPVNIGMPRSNVLFSITRCLKRPNVIAGVEYHTSTGEGNMALDGDMLVYLAPASKKKPEFKDFDAFLVPKGTFVSIHPGVWHMAPFAVDTDVLNCLVVLPERTYANDCEFEIFSEDERIEIEL